MNTGSVQFFSTTPNDSPAPNAELIIAAWEIKNPENVGHIIRLAHNAGAQKAVFIGDKQQYREKKIRKTGGFSYDQLSWEFVSEEEFYQRILPGYELVILETCTGAKNIFSVQLPSKAIILAGNESYGLPPEIIRTGSLSTYIPMPGRSKSMNVSHALAVAAFEWLRQQLFMQVCS